MIRENADVSQMQLDTAIYLVLILGGVGGLLRSILNEEGIFFGSYDRTTKVLEPGVIGNAIVGSIAALVVWGIYGPFAGQKIATGPTIDYSFTFSQAAGSLLVGIAGAEILKRLAEKRSEDLARKNLIAANKLANGQ